MSNMLSEISHLRQTNRSLVKRWFTSRDMDLFVWFHNNWLHNSMPVRFQLSFNKRNKEQAISWDFQREFQLYRVDSGETTPDRYKKTPLLISLCDQQELAIIARNFLVASENIDISIADFIYARLLEYPSIQTKHNVVHTGHHTAA